MLRARTAAVVAGTLARWRRALCVAPSELLAAGATRDEILADNPYLEADDITAVLEFAARQSDHPLLRSG